MLLILILWIQVSDLVGFQLLNIIPKKLGLFSRSSHISLHLALHLVLYLSCSKGEYVSPKKRYL